MNIIVYMKKHQTNQTIKCTKQKCKLKLVCGKCLKNDVRHITLLTVHINQCFAIRFKYK